jgi:hypothetical protein
MKTLGVLSVSAGLLFCSSSPASACPVPPPPDALVGLGLSSIRDDLEVRVHGEGDARSCHATLDLPVESLPSVGLAPRPREIAPVLAPVARALGVETCTVHVFVSGDDPTWDERDADRCWYGSYRFDGDFWRTESEDTTCW